MQSILPTVLTALFFTEIVSAAPPHLSAAFPKLPVYGFDESIDLDDLVESYKCAFDAIGRAVGDSDLRPLYEQIKQKAIADLLKCHDFEAKIEEKLSCIHVVVGNNELIYKYFLRKVHTENKEIFEKMQENLKGNCLNESNFFVSLGMGEFLREKHQCYINANKEASLKNGLTNEWNEYEPKFKQHLDALQQCSSRGMLIKIFCYIKEEASINALYVKYVLSINRHPNFTKFVDDFKQIMKEKC